MTGTDSDAEDFDFDSPLTSSFHRDGKPSLSQSPSRQQSVDRLYSVASTLRHAGSESEYSPLVNHREGPRSYHSTPSLERSDPFESSVSSSRPLGILTRKISRVFQSKAYDYDSDKTSLAAVGSGERVWYTLF